MEILFAPRDKKLKSDSWVNKVDRIEENQASPHQTSDIFSSFILFTSIAGNNPTTAITAKDKRKPAASAIKPINGGPIKNPRKEIDDTAASANPGFMVADFPARL